MKLILFSRNHASVTKNISGFLEGKIEQLSLHAGARHNLFKALSETSRTTGITPIQYGIFRQMMMSRIFLTVHNIAEFAKMLRFKVTWPRSLPH
ncbi:MAG: hypothetical protein WC756_21490 [Taibaiella sp.]|jgi:hypothetical protein